MRSTTQPRGQPEASISYWTATSQSGRSCSAASSRQRVIVSKSCGLRSGWLDDRQDRPQQRQPEHGRVAAERLAQRREVGLDRQLEDVQDPAAVDADRLRVEQRRGVRP